MAVHERPNTHPPDLHEIIALEEEQMAFTILVYSFGFVCGLAALAALIVVHVLHGVGL